MTGTDKRRIEKGPAEVNLTRPLPQPESHVIAKGEHDRPHLNEANADSGRVDSMDPAPHSDDPGFLPVSGGWS